MSAVELRLWFSGKATSQLPPNYEQVRGTALALPEETEETPGCVLAQTCLL